MVRLQGLNEDCSPLDSHTWCVAAKESGGDLRRLGIVRTLEALHAREHIASAKVEAVGQPSVAERLGHLLHLSNKPPGLH